MRKERWERQEEKDTKRVWWENNNWDLQKENIGYDLNYQRIVNFLKWRAVL